MESLAQYLAEAPIDFLRTVAYNLGIKIPEDKKNKRGQRQDERKILYKEIVNFFNQPQNLEKLWQSLREPERFFLELIHFTSSSSGAETNKVNEKMNKLWGKDIAWEVRKRVLDYGLVFLKKERYSREYYIIPAEVRYLISAQKVWTLVEPLRKEEPNCENHGLFLLIDFYILLASVLQWEIKVAQAGHIYKKDRKRILNLQHFLDDEVRYELLEKLAWGLQFLVEEEGRASLGKVTWEWLKLPQDEQWEIFTSWLLEPHFQGSQVWVDHIMSFLFLAAPHKRWLSLSNLYRLVADYNSGSTLELALTNIKEFIQKLTWLGLIELKGDINRGAIRLSQLGAIYGEKFIQRTLKENRGEEIPEERVQKLKEALEKNFPEVKDIVVQPDFEILAPLEINPGLFFELATFADLKSADRAFIFKLNERTLYRGFLKGRRFEDVLGLLEKHSKYPLPPNVRTYLEEWGARMGQVYLERGLLVRCLKEELSGQLKAFLEARGWLIEEIAPGVFLIPENLVRLCLLELEKAGFFPQPQVKEHLLPYLAEEQAPEDILSEIAEKFLGLKFK